MSVLGDSVPKSDLPNFCRLCACERPQATQIYSERGDELCLATKIAKCLPVVIQEGDELPKLVCDECQDKLEHCRQFFEQIHNATVKLLTILRNLEDADVAISSSQLSQYVRSYSDPKANDPGGAGGGAATGTSFADGGNGTNNDPIYSGKQEYMDDSDYDGDGGGGDGDGEGEEDLIDSKEKIHSEHLDTTTSRRPMRKSRTFVNYKTDLDLVECELGVGPTVRHIKSEEANLSSVKGEDWGDHNMGHEQQVTKQEMVDLDHEVDEVKAEPSDDFVEEYHREQGAKSFLDRLLNEYEDNPISNNNKRKRGKYKKRKKVQDEDYEDEEDGEGEEGAEPKKKKKRTGSKKDKNERKGRGLSCPPLKKCSLCGENFRSHPETVNHWQEEHGDQEIVYACDWKGCDLSTKMVLDMKKHRRQHMIDDKQLEKCPDCNKYYPSKYLETRHVLVHQSGKDHKCEECGKQFKSPENLKAHLRVHGPEDQKYTHCCDLCGRRFTQKANLEAHMRVHSGIKPYSCDQCKKKFSQKGNLDEHKRIHSGEKPYVCDICGSRHTRKGELLLHIRCIHTRERPFQCSYCPKNFQRRDLLRKHERIHTDTRPYGCEFCGKTFTARDKMIVHRRLHTGERPYVCNYCGRGFCESGNLKKHLRVHGKDIPAIIRQNNKGKSAEKHEVGALINQGEGAAAGVGDNAATAAVTGAIDQQQLQQQHHQHMATAGGDLRHVRQRGGKSGVVRQHRPKAHHQQKMIGHYMEDKGTEGELAMGGGGGGEREMKEEQEHDLSGGGGSAAGLPMVPYDDQVKSEDDHRSQDDAMERASSVYSIATEREDIQEEQNIRGIERGAAGDNNSCAAEGTGGGGSVENGGQSEEYNHLVTPLLQQIQSNWSTVYSQIQQPPQ